MLLLDSAAAPRPDRAEMVTTLMAEASAATVTLAPHEDLHARMEVWRLGRLNLFRSASSGMAMSRAVRQARRSETPIVALAVQEQSSACHEQFGIRQRITPGRLMLVDLTAPFAFSWSTTGASRALQVPIDALGLPMDVVRAAAPRLESSPLAGLVTRHVVDLFRAADDVAGGEQAAAVGAASIDLVRALLATTTTRDRVRRPVRHETLMAQVDEYVRQRLRDPDLGPDGIAAAHAVSRRHLFEVFAGSGQSLEQHIIARRLDAAYDELGRPGAEHKAIATVAHEWGFRDAAHFSRRFKESFGMTPREHRRGATGGHPPA